VKLSDKLFLLDIVLIFAVSILCLFSIMEQPASAQNSFNTTDGYSIYRNRNQGIEMEFPSDWIVSRAGLSSYSDIIGFYSPLESATDTFPEQVTVSMPVFSNITLNEYTNLINTTLSLPAIQIIDSTPVILAGSPARMMLFSVTDPNANITLTNMLVYTIIDDSKALNISFKSEGTKYSQYIPLAQHMIDSLKFIGQNSTSTQEE
jgi:hypothetical protein